MHSNELTFFFDGFIVTSTGSLCYSDFFYETQLRKGRSRNVQSVLAVTEPYSTRMLVDGARMSIRHRDVKG